MKLLPSIAVAVALTLAAAGAAPRALAIDERAPAVLLIVAPKHTAGTAPARELSEIIAAADRAARRATSLALRSAEQVGADQAVLDRCSPEERTTCWVRVVAEGASAPAARYLFVLSVLPESAERTRVSLLAVDVLAAIETIRGADLSAADARDRLEARLYASAVKPPPSSIAADTAAFERFFEEMFTGPLRAMLARRNDGARHGRIAIVSQHAGALAELEGRAIGALRAGTTTIEDVRPGRRMLAIIPADGTAVRLAIEVSSARTATVAVDAMFAAPDGFAPARTVELALGATALAAGTVLGVLAAVQGGDVRSACVTRAGESATCARNAGVTLAHDSSAAPAFGGELVDPQGLLTAPLAAALIGAGAIWIGGALFDAGDADDDVLWSLGLGVGAGVLIYGAGALLAGRF